MNSVICKESVAEFGFYKDEEGQERAKAVKLFQSGVSRNGVRHNRTKQSRYVADKTVSINAFLTRLFRTRRNDTGPGGPGRMTVPRRGSGFRLKLFQAF